MSDVDSANVRPRARPPSEARAQTAQLNPQLTSALPSSRTALVIIGGALLALVLGVMDQSIVVTAASAILHDLGGLNLYPWVFTAFILAQTVSMPILGKLSDMYGRKRFFIAGILIFIGGSILSGASQNIQELIAFRAVQGLGSGAFFSIGLAIVGASVQPERRAKVLGITGSVLGSGYIFGPTAGSYLVESVGWRWIFYVNIPLGLVAILLIGVALKESRAGVKRTVDWLGVGGLAGWVSFLLLALLNGGTTYPWYSWQEAFFFGGFLVLLPVFLLVESRVAEPILPLNLFRNRTISASFATQLARGAVFLGTVVYVSLFIQGALGGTIDDVRNLIYAFVVPFIIGSILSGQIVSRLGNRTVTLSGLIVVAVGAMLRVLIGLTPSLIEMAATTVPLGLGLGVTLASVLSAFQNSVDRSRIGIASSLSTFSQNLGGAIGVGILGSVQLNSLTTRLAGVVQQAPPEYQGKLAQLFASPDQVSFLLTSSSLNSSPLSSFLPQMRIALAGSVLDTSIAVLIMSIVAVAVAASTFVPGLSRQQMMARMAVANGQRIPVTPSVTLPSSSPTLKIGLDKRGAGLSISRTTSLILYTQSAIILILLAGLSREYQANAFMQQWVSVNASPLAYLLANYAGAILAAIVVSVGVVVRSLNRRKTSQLLRYPSDEAFPEK